jgi:hypothetical protein
VKLVLVVLAAAALVGMLAGGRLSWLSRMRLRWPAVAIVGLGLQLLPATGRFAALALLFGSFALLMAFAIVNLRSPGFPLVLIGTVLNATAIAMNGGMPVTAHALEASGQADALHALVAGGGAKHHLASSRDRLVLLGDVIAIPPPVSQAVSIGDVLTYAGAAWVVVAGMRRPGAPSGRSPGEPIREASPRSAA